MSLTPKIISIPQVNDLGSEFNDIHISGSKLVLQTDDNGILFGSLIVDSASYALTASYITASKIIGTIESSSYALSASYGYSSSYALSASYGYSSSYALSSSYSPPQDLSLLLSSSTFNNWTSSTLSEFNGTSSYAKTASYLPIGTYPITSSWSNNSSTASYLSGSVGIVDTFTSNNGIDVGGMSGNSQTQTAVQLGFGLSHANNILNSVQVGYQAGLNSTTATNAVQVGYQAGYNATSGAFTTFIGSNADTLSSLLQVSKSIAIGYNAKVSGSNMAVIGGTGVDAVNVGIGTSTPLYSLHVVGDIKLGVNDVDVTTRKISLASNRWISLENSGINFSNWYSSAGFSHKFGFGGVPSFTIGSNKAVYIHQTTNTSMGISITPTNIYGADNVIMASQGYYVGIPNIRIKTDVPVGLASPLNSGDIILQTGLGVLGGSPGTIKFEIGANTEIMRITGSKVGIGTNNPVNTLEVVGNVSASSFTGSHFGTSSYANTSSLATTASYGYSSSYALSSSYSPPQDLSPLLSSSTFNNWTGSNTSFFYGTASNSKTASYLPIGTYPITSSWSNNSLSASYINGAHTGSTYGTSSWSNNSISASYSTTASYGYSSSYALSSSYSPPQDLSPLLSSSTFNNWSGSILSQFNGTSSYAKTASYLPIGSYNITSSWSNNSISSSYALTASYATNGGGSGTSLTTGSTYPITSSWAQSSSYAVASLYSETSDFSYDSQHSVTASFTTSASYLNKGATLYLSQSYITSDINGTKPAWQEGMMFWDKENHTYAIYNDQSDITLQIGQETLEQVYAGENLLNGDAITLSGSFLTYPIGWKAISDGVTRKYNVAGVATQNITSGSRGYITIQGRINDIDTSAYPAGSLLYLSSTNAGKYTITPPSEPSMVTAIGHCLYQDATTGKMLVNISLTPDPIHPYIGMINNPSISIVGNTVTVGTGSVTLSTTSDGLGIIKAYPLQSASFVITSSLLDSQYIYAAYNNGSPIYQIANDRNTVDNIQSTNVYTITVGANNSLSYVGWDALGVLLANKLFTRTVNVHGIERETGLILSESGSRYITVTSGAAWQGVQKINLSSINSSTNRVVLVFHSGSNAFSSSLITQYNNTQYDDGTGLQTLTGNRYTVNWVYRGIGNLNTTVVMLGNVYNQYTDAHDAQPPTPPSELKDIAILVGRAIYQQNNANATIIESAFNESFSSTGITDHNLLNNIQGGTSLQYYHLTAAEYGNTSSGSFIRQTGSFISGSITNATSASYSLSSSYSNVASRVNYKITTLSSDTTLDPTNHYTVLINASSGNKTISLPSASVNNGTLFNIKKIDSTGYNVIINSVDAAPIDGNSSLTIQNRYTTLTVQCSGSNWWII